MTRTFLLRVSTYAVIGGIALLAACDRESPTDVARPVAHASMGDASAAVTAAAGGKPTPASTYEIKTSSIDVIDGNEGVVEVLCSAGKRALGGGFQIGGGVLAAGPEVAVYESSPRVTSGTDGWRLDAVNRGSTEGTRRFDVWVICAAI